MAEGSENTEASDKTEAATPQRLEKARREGDVPLSRETVHFAALGAGILGMAALGPQTGRSLAEAAQGVLAGAHELQLQEAIWMLLGAALPAGLGIAAMAALGALAATLLQTGFLVSSKGLVPQFSRLNPGSGLKRIFGMNSVEEFTRTVLKLGTIGSALWWAAGDPLELGASFALGAPDLAASVATLLGRLLTATLAAMALIAGLDMLWVRLRYARRLRMSRQEMKEEMRESEGDPQLRARRRQIQRTRSRRRMLAEVPKATVVVTNPTHYAVALAYERGKDAAPRIVAKGVDTLAARIREVADQHGVPIVPNPPLARALYRLPEEAEIPPEHFKAVAEVIAFVMRLKGGAGTG